MGASLFLKSLMFHTALHNEIENMFRILVTFTEVAEAVEAIRVIRSAKQKCPPVKVNKGFSPFAFLAFILISVNTIMNISNNISNNNNNNNNNNVSIDVE